MFRIGKRGPPPLTVWRALFNGTIFLVLGMIGVLSLAGILATWVPQLETFGNLQGYMAAGAVLAGLWTLVMRAPGWGAAALVLVAANAATVAYRMTPLEPCPVERAGTGQQAVKVLTHNILWDNHDFDTLEGVLRKPDPDVIILQEIQPHHMPLFARMAGDYPYSVVCPDVEHCGIVILSRHPLRSRKPVLDRFGEVIALDAVVTVGGSDLVVLGTHLVQPFRGRTQRGQIDRLADAVGRLPGNAMVAGDFNSVGWSANMRRFSERAGVCTANRTAPTWPVWLGPAGIPIDQVFLKPGLRLLTIETVQGSGSDHRALLANIGLP